MTAVYRPNGMLIRPGVILIFVNIANGFDGSMVSLYVV